VAQYAQLVAESLDGVSPEDAYLVGLLHGIGDIPEALGWPNAVRGGKGAGALFEMEGTLPLFVLSAMRSMNDSSSSSNWRFIINTAHELAGVRMRHMRAPRSRPQAHQLALAVGRRRAEQGAPNRAQRRQVETPILICHSGNSASLGGARHLMGFSSTPHPQRCRIRKSWSFFSQIESNPR